MEDLSRLRALAGLKAGKQPAVTSHETVNGLKEVTLTAENEIAQQLPGDDVGQKTISAILNRSFRVAVRRGASSIQDFQKIADAVIGLAPAYRNGDDALRSRIAAISQLSSNDVKNA
jgi:hypothetical protein